MNNITITGNLTAKPELRATTTGKSVCNFDVAVNRRYEKDDDGKNVVDYFRVSVWGSMAENCAKYLDKGKKVAVTGECHHRKYRDRDGNVRYSLEIASDQIEFLSPKEKAADPQPAPDPHDDFVGYETLTTDDFPF